MPRLTYFKWTEAVIGKIQAVTPKEGEEAPGVITDEQHIKKALGYDRAALAKDKRPVLIYFHWPHEHKQHGKLTETICTKVLNDEHAARWSKLFRCVQIDMGQTETKFSEMIGDVGKPAFVTLDDELEVVSRIEATKSGSKLRKAMEAAFNKFPAARKELKKRLAQQKKDLAKAKKLEKAKEYEEAMELVDAIRFGELRVGKDWDKAYAYGMKLALKVEQEMEK